MEILIKNAKILNEENELYNVNILIEDSKFKRIYKQNAFFSDERITKNAKIIDANFNMILPGFININTSLLKKYFYENNTFDCYSSFLEEFEIFRNKLSEEEKYFIYKYEILNAIKNGVTTICEEDLYNLPLKKAMLETKCKTVYKLGVNNCLEEFNIDTIYKLSTTKTDFILSLNSVLYNNEDNFSDITKLSKTYNKPIICNSSLNLNEAGEVDNSFNSSTVNLLNNYGFLDYQNILFGANVLDKEDYNLLKNSSVSLVFSPSLNLSFAFNDANIYALSLNNKIGLSSFKNDFFIEMFLLKNLENNNYDKTNLFDYFEIFNMATKNNAEILNLQNCGQIKEGYDADFVIYEISNIANNDEILSKLNSSNIISTFINGEEVFNKNINIFEKDLLGRIKKIDNK